jgi:hypothetical protein
MKVIYGDKTYPVIGLDGDYYIVRDEDGNELKLADDADITLIADAADRLIIRSIMRLPLIEELRSRFCKGWHMLIPSKLKTVGEAINYVLTNRE